MTTEFQQKYVIVKHAGTMHVHYWEQDPKETGVSICHSCFDTHTGKQHDIQETYFHKEYAESDCVKINEANPSGDYAVCKLIEEPTNV